MMVTGTGYNVSPTAVHAESHSYNRCSCNIHEHVAHNFYVFGVFLREQVVIAYVSGEDKVSSRQGKRSKGGDTQHTFLMLMCWVT